MGWKLTAAVKCRACQLPALQASHLWADSLEARYRDQLLPQRWHRVWYYLYLFYNVKYENTPV